MEIRDFCITRNYTIMEVMQVFERNRERGVLVVGEDEKVCGFISMGDIINALANGKNLYSRAEQISNPSFIYLEKKDYKKALEIFKKRNISLIPVIDKEQKVVDVITARELFAMVELK